MILIQNQELLRLSNFYVKVKNTVDVVIALDLRADEVQAIYREFWELKGMYRLAQIYDEASVAMQYTSVCNPL